MRMVDIIAKKRDRQPLTTAEIEFFVSGFTNGEVPDYQAAAWAMAVLLNGMDARETTDLTLAMARSGEMLDLSRSGRVVVDKHSTGGVGDKTTLVVEPLVAASGLPVGKMSGRGLGFSGGTLDKMESIPGFRTDLNTRQFQDQLDEIGLVLTGQTAGLAPADGKLYALRDVTATVQSIPLIASSVMSKKLAAGAQAIVLDVKVGLGAFMRDLESARALASLMVAIAHGAGRKAVALLSDMNQPLGHAVGNALEVREAIDTLQGQGPQDFKEHCLMVAAHMLALGEVAGGEDQGRQLAVSTLESGQAWERFRQLVAAQGGDLGVVDQPETLPAARLVVPLASERSGFIRQAHARVIGETAVVLGAGRARKGDPVDHAVGIVVHVKVGDPVESGQPLCTIYANHAGKLDAAMAALQNAFIITNQEVEPLPLFYGVVS